MPERGYIVDIEGVAVSVKSADIDGDDVIKIPEGAQEWAFNCIKSFIYEAKKRCLPLRRIDCGWWRNPVHHLYVYPKLIIGLTSPVGECSFTCKIPVDLSHVSDTTVVSEITRELKEAIFSASGLISYLE